MFSISAINDTDSKGNWEPLAPTKEAQEFRLSQTYHEGLHKFQAKEYDKARELLESVLKDPLMENVQVDGSASDGHLLQLRFLALKNLASVFLQQGSSHHENALQCYLQAVEIDEKDSVIWNQLGTLSCSMGVLSISRWAFEQGLICSPNNWNCMEKLLEILIAIGDEVSCLSIAELILRHWPSHSRALHVKKTIKDPEPVPFAPKGIDKLEPRHVRLKFRKKRKSTDEGIAHKKLNRNLELHLKEASWVSLAESLLDVLLQASGSEDVKLVIRLPSGSDNTAGGKGTNVTSYDDSRMEISIAGKEKDLSIFEEQPQERRSSRLERLRNRKPEKEDLDCANENNSNNTNDNKNQSKLVRKYLEPFVTGETAKCSENGSGDWSTSRRDPCDTEVCEFVRKNTNNFGAYHMSYLLLEAAAIRGLVYQDGFIKLLELEKMTRHWAKERTAECNLLLSELYYDLGSSSSDASRVTEMMSEASHHLCKIIESAALNYPHQLSSEGNCEGLAIDSSHQHSAEEGLSLVHNNSFWVRFFWLRGRLSLLDGNKERAHDQLTISLSLLANKKTVDDDSQCVIRLPHMKIFKEITMDRVLHLINILKVDLLMENKTLAEMMEKEMYMECTTLLAPLVLLPKDVFLEALYLPSTDIEGDGITSLELSAIDMLLKACEKVRPMDIELYLKCHRRKLQVLVAMAGNDECNAACKSLHLKSGPKPVSVSDTEIKESPGKKWNNLVFEEVKSISKCASQIKKYIDSSRDSESIIVPTSSISDIQSLLLSVMCSVAGKKSSGFVIVDKTERNCFIIASAALCKLQHLNLITPAQNQVDLIVATHDMLAEFGICCAGEDGSGEEGLFLKLSIKHLLALSMKLKSNSSSLNEETTESSDEPASSKMPLDDAKSETREETSAAEEASTTLDKDSVRGSGAVNNNISGEKLKTVGKESEESREYAPDLFEDEKDELELSIDTALEQCFFCLYGLNIRSDSFYEDDPATHRNTCRGDYQTKEQCADVFQYILPYAKASSKTGLVKLRRVLRAIRKHFPEPPEGVLAGNPVEKFLDDPDLCEDKLSEEAGSDGFLETVTKVLLPKSGSFKQHKMSLVGSSEPYMEIYKNLYYFLALSEEVSATDKWPGFVLTKEGEEFVQHNAKLFKYDLLYNPRRFESWQRLGNTYDEEVDLLLNDGSKHINVAGWRKSDTLPQRVEESRKRSRRCLLMSLALAKTSTQQYEIHELLALVYYDSLQNVVPFFDQRSAVPVRDAAWVMCCENSMRHFKKASAHSQDWSHAYYIGKLCEKLGFSIEVSLSYYEKAIALNPTAVDPVYRMHASRLKKLFTCGKQNLEAFKVLSQYSFSQSKKDAVRAIVDKIDAENSQKEKTAEEDSGEIKHEDLLKLEVWRILYSDCLAALEACVEGDLKHFHKARYMLAQGLYKRGESGDLDRAKDELSFCFKSSRSSFTINMWEIDSMVKKGRRKTPGITGSKKILEVNLPESSRKFITCIRKYLLFYLKLLEETGEISTLERAYVSLRADRRFSLCIEDLVPVALGRYVKALVSCVRQPEKVSSEQMLEKLFALFIEQGNMWPDICALPEIKCPETSDTTLYGYLHEHITSLERNGKLEALETINEKLRKRFKNPKLSNSNCAKVCRHASIAWCRALVISLGQITPDRSSLEAQPDGGSDTNLLLCVDLQTDELWSSVFEDPAQLKALETKWRPVQSKLKRSVVKKASSENSETASALLKSAYNFYRESSCVMPPSGVNLYLVPSWLAMESQVDPNMNTNTHGVEVLDLSVPRKLILWAYTLLHGRHANISLVVKHCEESLKSKMRKGAGAPSTPSYSSVPGSTTSQTGGARDSDAEATTTTPRTGESQKGLFVAPQLHHCNSFAERSSGTTPHEGPADKDKT